MRENEADKLPEQLQSELTDPKLPVDANDPKERQEIPYPTAPEPSNADNTALDRFADIHSGSALPDPIGDTVEDARIENPIDYYQADILDEDPILGGPEGVANRIDESDPIENIADIDIPPEDPEP